ncbi:c-type cytochrome [Roseateles flavus]|uniref:Cytochrome c4 n=1 Tax=Roseateles flavus TaxID=3149041 RepID=A0ABV0G9S1_9BURK
MRTTARPWTARWRPALAALALLASAAQAQTPPPFEDSMAQRLLACTGCHGPQGRAGRDGYYPRLAGKPAGYLYQQLLSFREGRRQYGPMNTLLAPLSDDYLQAIATHFASLDLPYPPPQPPAMAPADQLRAQTLVRQGHAQRKLPACQQCHGEALLGRQPGVPGLLGLPRDYLLAQLAAWRQGERRSRTPDCMADIARRLDPEDIRAVADWLSAQAVPTGAKPAPASDEKLPLQCGGLP